MTAIMLLVAAFANIFGGLLVLMRPNWSKKRIQHFVALSAEFLFAIAMLDLIPESLEHIETAPLWMVV